MDGHSAPAPRSSLESLFVRARLWDTASRNRARPDTLRHAEYSKLFSYRRFDIRARRHALSFIECGWESGYR